MALSDNQQDKTWNAFYYSRKATMRSVAEIRHEKCTVLKAEISLSSYNTDNKI